MTLFEELANELGVKLTYSEDGRYNGMAEALGIIADNVICGDDTYYLDWNEQIAIIKERFIARFPYMSK